MRTLPTNLGIFITFLGGISYFDAWHMLQQYVCALPQISNIKQDVQLSELTQTGSVPLILFKAFV